MFLVILMKSIKKRIHNELVINKSTFINYLIPVDSVDAVLDALTEIKKDHKDASHHCTAYIIGNNQEIQKANDDGEPSKTAGYPMLEVVKKHNLTNVLAVTVRYFGGIKLGAGGLVRAYTKSVAESILLCQFSRLEQYITCTAVVSFDMIGVAEKYIRDDFELLDTTYDTHVHYKIKMKKARYNPFKERINNLTKGSVELQIVEESEAYE